jgi:predicted DNA-binding transcriptional regulator YafY
VRGRYGGYRLASGYRMPPLMLTDEEALAVLLGLVAGRRSERTVHPYGIVVYSGRWYVTGADSASGEVRTFRLDRIETATVLPESFEVPAGFDPAARVLSGLAEVPYLHEVSLRVRGTAEQVRSRLPAGIATVQELPADPAKDRAVEAACDLPEVSAPQAAFGAREDGGWVRVRLRAERLEWVPSVLAWLDRPFVIEYPDALRDHVHALARRLATCADTVTGADGRTAGSSPPPAVTTARVHAEWRAARRGHANPSPTVAASRRYASVVAGLSCSSSTSAPSSRCTS